MLDLLNITADYYLSCTAKIRGHARRLGFSLNEFKALKNFREINDYLKKTELTQIGIGTSRNAYLLTSRFVIKMAQNPAGIQQNRIEIELSQDPKISSIIANVKDQHPNALWIVADIVRPLGKDDEKEFENLSGESYNNFHSFVTNLIRQTPWTSLSDFFVQVKNILSNDKISMGDIRKLDSWGKTPDGRLVLFDYGMTKDIMSRYYSYGWPKQRSFPPSVLWQDLDLDYDDLLYEIKEISRPSHDDPLRPGRLLHILINKSFPKLDHPGITSIFPVISEEKINIIENIKNITGMWLIIDENKKLKYTNMPQSLVNILLSYTTAKKISKHNFKIYKTAKI